MMNDEIKWVATAGAYVDPCPNCNSLQASRDRWRMLALIHHELFNEACEFIYEETHGTWPTAKVRQIHIKEDEIIAALKESGEWEE